MKPIQRAGLFLWFAFVVVFVLNGCVGLQSYPHRARAGDTITLSLGSGEFVTRNNTTVVYTPDSDPGNSIDLTSNITAVFKLYPDKSSYTALDDGATVGISIFGTHEPWINIVAINLPATLFDGSPFPVGTGSIQVTTTGSYSLGSTSPNDVTMALEILPGNGEAFPMQYDYFGLRTGNLVDLEPQPQVVVRGVGSGGTFGAIKLVLDVPMREADGVTVVSNGVVEIFRDQLNITGFSAESSQTNIIWSRTGDFLTLYYTSPIGMQSRETSCSIVLRRSRNGFYFSAPPSLVTIQYYDLNGNETTGPNPTVALQQ